MENLGFKILVALGILFSNILAIIPFYLSGVYANCLFDLLALPPITLTSLDTELAKKFFIQIWSYLIHSENIEDITCHLIEFFLSIMQLIFLILYLAIDEFTLKITSKDTHHNINNMHNDESNAIYFMMNSNDGSNDDDPVWSKTNKGKYKATILDQDQQDPAISITDKAKGQIIDIEQEEHEQEDEDGHYSIYSPSEYSVIDTNTINSDDDEELVEKKLALQELDRKLQQEARDREMAMKLENDLTLNEELDNTDLFFNVEKVSSDLNKEINRLNSYFPSETGQASSSNTTEESTTSKEPAKKHILESDLNKPDNKKNKK